MIDFHVHCYPMHLSKAAYKSVIIDGENRKVDHNSVTDLMKDYGINQFVVHNIAKNPNNQNAVNNYAIHTKSDSLIPFGSIHPDSPDALEEIDRLYNAGIIGIKLHPIFQRFHFNNKKYIPIYEKIGSLNFIVMIHCGLAGRDAQFACNPSTVAEVIEYFNGTPVILAHMGGILIAKTEYPILYNLPVYIDTSLCAEALPPKFPRLMDKKLFSNVIEHHGIDRVLFGSDYPWGLPNNALSFLNSVGLHNVELQKIIDSNGKKLLNSYRRI